jgi:GAF domain-containing protein
VIADKTGLPWDDGISSLVALSGESLSIHGSPLARFKISNIGQSALIVPLKVRKEVIGILVVIRKEAKPFSPSNQTLLEAVADYASISLVNAQLFHALEDRAQSLQKAVEMAQSNERSKEQLILRLQGELKTPLDNAIITLQNLLLSEESRLNAAQKGVLRSAQAEMKRVGTIIANYRPGPQK